MALSIKLCHATVVQHSPSLVYCLADLGDEAALSMGIMLWAGILVVAFVLLLLAVDVTCYFVNKCGLIMCLCGKSGEKMCLEEKLGLNHLQCGGFVLPLGSPCNCWANAEAGGSCWQGLRCLCHPAPWAGVERKPTALPAAEGASCGCSSEAGTNQTWPL